MARHFVKFALCILYFALCINISHAQQIEFSSTLNPVGSGARATGMGGAFIGVADDATAASWNPAGLIQLEKPELSLVYADFSRGQTYHSSNHPEINGTNTMDAGGLNYASAAYPLVALDHNMIISLNYQRLYDMNKKVDFRYNWDLGGGDILVDSISFRQKGHLYAVSPAAAVQVNPDLYLGVTLNFWGDYLGKNGWENIYQSSASGSFLGNAVTQSIDWKNTVSFDGFNTHAGFLWTVSGTVTIGGVYKTAFDGNLQQDTIFSQIQNGTASPPSITTERLTMKMPASYGLGLQYRRSDSLTLAADLYQTDWSRFFIKDSVGNETNPIDGQPLGQGRLRDTTQARLGAEYLFIGNNKTVALRAGAFYDPEPSRGKVDDYYGLSLGAGYTTAKYSLDASYQYRQGRDVDGDISFVQPGSADITQQTIMLSGIYYF